MSRPAAGLDRRNPARQHTRWFAPWCIRAIAATLIAGGLLQARPAHAAEFYLKAGDRVVFYGDSITEQRYYPVAVQTFVRTRFPRLHVSFVDSGVSADMVNGGWAGSIHVRLQRDVLPFHPTVVTIMLGMNDGRYQPFNPDFFAKYQRGYIHIIHWLQSHLPHVRIVLIQPSPYDNYSAPLAPQSPLAAYNQVLIRYGRFLQQLAAQNHMLCVNFNRPLVDLIRQVKRINPRLATQIIPQRVHPGATAQMVMAQALLRAWHAPALVSAVAINGASGSLVRAANTKVSHLSGKRTHIAWTQHDRCLPYPLMTLHRHWMQFPWVVPNWPSPVENARSINPLAALVFRLSRMYQVLDSQMLRVTGLLNCQYRLSINGRVVGTFSAAQLQRGINLACYNTPMMAQAYRVMYLVWKQTQNRFIAWRRYQLPALGFGYTAHGHKAHRDAPAALQKALAITRSMYRQCAQMNAGQYAAARPGVDHYALVAMVRAKSQPAALHHDPPRQ